MMVLIALTIKKIVTPSIYDLVIISKPAKDTGKSHSVNLITFNRKKYEDVVI